MGTSDGEGRYGVPDATRPNLVRWFVVPSYFALAALIVVFAALRAANITVPPEYRYVPFLATLVVLGLPHGAVDHLVPERLRGDTPTLRGVALVMAGYTVVFFIYAGAWFVAPAASFAFFIVLTWLHWGQGDLHASASLLRTRVSGVRGAPVLAARGALPMLVPLVAFPDEYREVADAVIRVFDERGAETVAFAFEPTFRAGVAVVVAVLCVASVAAVRRRRREAGEIALLVTYFSVVPPILAVGFYFAFWHSARHIARLIALDPVARRRAEDGDATGALGKFAYDAAPLTAASLVLLAGLYFVAGAPATLEGVFAVYLILLAALTLPHFFVVSLMDRAQSVW